MLFLGPFGGLVADRLDKRKVLYATQGAAGVLALGLGVTTAMHAVTLWEVYAFAAGLGFVNLFDNPARQTCVSEMVGHELLPNAVSLNSVLMNSARVIGPAIGGLLIVTLGVATCFFVNALSYAAVITALAMMRASELYRRPGVARAKGQVRQGLRYAWASATCGCCWSPWRWWACSPSTSPSPCPCWPNSPSTAAPGSTAGSWWPWEPVPWLVAWPRPSARARRPDSWPASAWCSAAPSSPSRPRHQGLGPGAARSHRGG